MNYKEGVVITATEFKKNLGKYIDFVETQNDVVITKNGKKIVRLTPYVTDIEQYFTVRENALDYQYGGKKVSYEEFMEISEKSTLRMELINGEIYLLGSPNLGHQELLARLYLIFNDYLKDKKCRPIFAPFDVHFWKKDIKEPDVMQPDLLVACDLEGNVNENGRYMGTPTLTVEILSKSTRSKDMVDKLNTYMMSGVREYWIIDTKQKTVMIYDFVDYTVDLLKIFKKGDIAESIVFEGLTADVGELFENLI
ncbi:MAG TPA: type II toxin-antitoxin system Phd/YefM family antitoxin [Clostridia bacterium]|nr:type II toxin-antitoxin system Phd/YefM family antitoxin [Clostridia bacterium]